MEMETPSTLLAAVRYFSDIERCEEYLRKLRWPTGTIRCPECDSTNVGEIKTRRLLQCRECRRQIYTKRGTIFEDSPLGLDKWFVAVWAIANCKNGISSHELARALGVQQKTAWFMLHRIRVAMEVDDGGKFNGPTEADTTYVGGRAENMHKGRREKVLKGGRGSPGAPMGSTLHLSGWKSSCSTRTTSRSRTGRTRRRATSRRRNG